MLKPATFEHISQLEHISELFLVFLLLSLNRQMFPGILSQQWNSRQRNSKQQKFLVSFSQEKEKEKIFYKNKKYFSIFSQEDIILQTKITYPQKELLQIIPSHLTAQGNYPITAWCCFSIPPQNIKT